MAGLGTFVRTHRKARDLNVTTLAEQLGVTPQSVSDIELGKTKTLKASTAFKMVQALALEGDDYDEFLRLLDPEAVPA